MESRRIGIVLDRSDPKAPGGSAYVIAGSRRDRWGTNTAGLKFRLEVDSRALTKPEGQSTIDAVAKRDDGWVIAVTYSLGDDGLVLGPIRLLPPDGTPGTAGERVLRGLGFGRVTKELEAYLQDHLVLRHLGPRWRAKRLRSGRSGTPDMVYALVAQRYVEAMKAAPRSPVRHMVDNSTEHETEAQIRWQLNQARGRGLLTAAPPGRPGGGLTPKAKKLLRNLEKPLVDRPAPKSTGRAPR